MKSYSIGLYEKALPPSLSWYEKLSCAKECGYDFLEISIDETDEKLARLDWNGEEIDRLKKDAENAGLPIRSMCLSGHRKFPLGSSDPAVGKRSLQIMEKAIILADGLGIRVIQLAGYDVYYESSTPETVANFDRNLREAVEMASGRGIFLGFETMETAFMDTVWKSMFYVRRINSPYLGVYPDCGNLTNASHLYHSTVYDDLESGRGHILALHLKETLPGKYREIPFLTGQVDFEAVIRKAWSMGVRRYVTELWDTGKPSWKEDIRFANRSMTSILDRQENQQQIYPGG